MRGDLTPFSAAGVATSLDRRRVDQEFGRRTAGRGQGVEDVHPDAFGRPAHETIVEHLARTVDRRRIDLATTRLQHVDDPADHAAVVGSRHAARVRRKMRHEPSILKVVQPKIIPFRERSPFGDLESRNEQSGNRFYRSGA